jgi:hypothetical protein
VLELYQDTKRLHPNHAYVGQICREAGIAEGISDGGNVPTYDTVEDAEPECVSVQSPFTAIRVSG